MEKLTKAKLAKQTKEDLTRMGKIYGLSLSSALSKEGMIDAILKAEAKAPEAKAPAKKGTAAKAATAKKAAPAAAKKSVAAKAAPAKAAAKKAVAPVKKAVAVSKAASTVVSAKAEKLAAKAAPVTSAPKKPIPTKAARPASPPSPTKGLAASSFSVKIAQTATPVPAYHAGEEEMVEESKYHIATQQAQLDSAWMPDRYEDNRIILLPRDPFWAHSAWDLHPEKPAQTALQHNLALNECRMALRVYDVTDIVFNGANAHKFFDMEVHTLKAGWYVNMPEDDRTWIVEIGLKDRFGSFYMMARSSAVAMPRNSVSNRTDENWMVADEDFWQMYALSGGFKARSSSMSLDLQQQMQERLSGESSSGAVSSFVTSLMPRKKAQDQFWFRLDCELIVYGATEPDASVTLAGKQMQLRPDGTFTARFALPDGMQILEATAVSANRKFEKTITPTVTRGTTVLQNRAELKEETEE